MVTQGPGRHVADGSLGGTSHDPVRLAKIAGLVTLNAFILGLNLVVLKVAMRYAGPVSVQTYAAIAGAAAYIVIVRASGNPTIPKKHEVLPAFAVGMLLTVGSSLGVVFGVQRVDAGIAAVILAATPIITLLLSWVILRERRTWHGLLGIAVGLVGVSVVAIAARQRDPTEFAGVLFMLLGSTGWSMGLVLMKSLAEGIRRSSFIAWQTLFGVPVLIAVGLVAEGLTVNWTLLFVFAVLYAGIASKSTSFFLQLTVVRLGSSIHASTVAFLIPVFGTLAGVVLLGEAVRPEQVYGALAVVAGIGLVLRSRVHADVDVPEL